MSDARKEVRPVRVGVFDSFMSADVAYQSLIKVGFTSEEITVLCSNEWQQRHFPDSVSEVQDPESIDAAAGGGALGALLGGLGAVAGLATVAGIPVIVAGGLAGALGGSVVGGLTGVMAKRGFEKEASDYFDQAVSDGKIMISVEPKDHDLSRLKTAEKLLGDAGANAISLLEG